MGGLLAKAAGYVTFFTVLIAIAVLTLGGVAIAESALSSVSSPPRSMPRPGS
jgi:hypothetical protein